MQKNKTRKFYLDEFRNNTFILLKKKQYIHVQSIVNLL